MILIIQKEKEVDVMDSVTYYLGYQAKIQSVNEVGEPIEIDNPQTKEDFLKQKIVEYIKSCYRSYKANVLADAARLQAINDANQVSIEIG